ncbi:hypothetical protein WICPIJ_004497 [Wickerhamomyces pijperi]|uniref:Protein fyv10 n=1 Tax=Wickerhamomyces pijperi TaxID=599730 RepID=A0A9P8TMP8_WICPI|nr:hypothetical protein WICPIJ_004497 [Wickerhamomyces pijperi]
MTVPVLTAQSDTNFTKADSIHDPNVDLQIKLQSYSYRIPLEMIRQNFKTIQKLEERQLKKLEEFKKSLKSSKTPEQTSSIKKSLITSLKLFEKKLTRQVKIEEELLSRINARAEHLAKLKPLQEAYQTSPSEITKDELLNWYRDQTNLLIITHLLKESNDPNVSDEDKLGLKLMKSLHMEKLVDYDVLTQASRISQDIKRGKLTSLITWITENKTYLTKIRSELEFQTRFQEYIELIKNDKTKEALAVFQNHLSSFAKTNFDEITQASSLLVINPGSLESLKTKNHSKYDTHREPYYPSLFRNQESHNTFSQYLHFFSPDRYESLSEIFQTVYYELHGIPKSDPLMVYLSIGISALKTKSCQCPEIKKSSPIASFEDILREKLQPKSDTCQHSASVEENSTATIINSIRPQIPSCPVCSLEFRGLASTLPYAHNTKSSLFENPIMLPNGNIFDRERLIGFTRAYLTAIKTQKIDLSGHEDEYYLQTDVSKSYPTGLRGVIDPIEGVWYDCSDMVTVFPS